MLKRPKLGEIIETRYGPAAVVAVRSWDEIKEELSEEERRNFANRVECFLGNVEEYFEYVVRYLDDSEYDIYDWSEYGSNFQLITSITRELAGEKRMCNRGKRQNGRVAGKS